ncbi:MAG: hypothetical protein SGI77_11375, partial [Pirellulaceae bacterium]|nr:hypothetical protein [Pirellulaceae bacterium]
AARIMAPRLQTYDGKLLYLDGKLIYDDGCCCDNACDSCPVFESICTATLQTPFGNIEFKTDFPTQPRVRWNTEIRSGVCWKVYDETLYQDGCVGNCEESFTPDEPDTILICDFQYEPPADPDEDCPSCPYCPDPPESGFIGTKTFEYFGQMAHVFRQLASFGLLRVQYEYNCETQILYRKWYFEYIYSQDLSGYFRGDLIYRVDVDYPTETPPCVIHTEEILTVFNKHFDGCDYFPLMPNRPGYPVMVDQETWQGVGSIQGGLDYGICGKVIYDEDWTVVSTPPFQVDINLTPKVTDIPPDFLGIHDCPVVIGENPAIEVEYKCDADHRRAFIEYDAPEDFSCWICGPPEVPFKLIDGGCTYPPDGVIFVLDEPVPTQPANLEDEPDFTPYSFQHELSFTTKPYDEDCPSP